MPVKIIHESQGTTVKARSAAHRQRTSPRTNRSVRRQTPIRRLHVRRILVPVDFSDTAYKPVPYAVALAEDMGAKIILMHVVEPVYVGAEPGLTYVAPQTMIAERKPNKDELRKIAQKMVPEKLFDKAIVREGTPYHEITAMAKRLKVGLIVITTHGRTGLSHILMGSTAEHVVRHARCPVLTVRRT